MIIRINFLFRNIIFEKNIIRLDVTYNVMVVTFLVSVCLIAFSVFSWGRFYIRGRKILRFFFIMLILFVSSILILIIRNRFFTIFLGWEGLGITSFLLIIYYQNWLRIGGGLLTLLTNRLGDRLLIITFCYWMAFSSFKGILQRGGVIIFLLLLFTSLTKRAQVPFTRWLPAAIAAPTPVRALVHSSTLVTAGVWLMVRFQQVTILRASIWLILGRATLLAARRAAIIEIDGKKVVALSTLRQLGLIFVSLSIGNYFICLFHLLIHAFAKANLFLMVGNLLHFRFSQQDSRYLSTGLEEMSVFLITFIRIIRLRGVIFTRGFFSKDSILIREFFLFNRRLSLVFILRVISLTLSYCLKVLAIFLSLRITQVTAHNNKRMFHLITRRVIGIFRIMSGYFILNNLALQRIIFIRDTRVYWIYLLIRRIILGLIVLTPPKLWLTIFNYQLRLIKKITNEILSKGKEISQRISSTYLESSYLTLRLINRRITVTQLNRRGFIVVCVILGIMFI